MQSQPRFPARLLLGFTGFLCALAQLQRLGAAPVPPREEEEFFEAKIRPVLVSQCYECHAADSKKVKGGLLLDTREGLLRGGESGPALVPGKAAESMLVAALKHENLEMPPKKKLSEEVVGDFVRWIERGAVDPRLESAPVAAAGKGVAMEKARNHWAFVPPVRGPAPRCSARNGPGARWISMCWPPWRPGNSAPSHPRASGSFCGVRALI